MLAPVHIVHLPVSVDPHTKKEVSMFVRSALVLSLLCAVAPQPAVLSAQVSSDAPERAVRRDMPLTNAIRRRRRLPGKRRW